MGFLRANRDINRLETPEGQITLLGLFLPLLIETLLRNLMGTVSVVILSQYSDNAVAAVGAATQLLNMVQIFYTLVATGVAIIINQNLGAGNRRYSGEVATVALVLCAGLSILTGAAMSIFALPLMGMMQLTGEVLVLAADYFRIVTALAITQALITLFSFIVRCYGRTQIAMVVALVMNVINALLCLLVVYRPFETPLQGVAGIGWARIISEAVALGIMIIAIRRVKVGFTLRALRPLPVKMIRQIFAVSIPPGVANLSYGVSQVVSTAIIATLGMAAVSAKVYLSNIFFYVYLLGMCLGQVTTIMIGRMVGAGEYQKAERLNRQNIVIGIACNVVLSVLVVAFYRPVLGMFTSSEEIIAMCLPVMFADILVEIGRAFNNIEGGCLNGAGDMVFSMAISVPSCWLISILFSYILGVVCGLGLVGCWIAFAMDELARGMAQMMRWRSRKWMSKSLIRRADG